MAGRAEPLQPSACAGARRPQARRPRHGLGQGPLLGPRDQGPEVARGLARDARRLRGRPDAARDAAPQAARSTRRGTRCRSARSGPTRSRSTSRDLDRFEAGDEVTPETLKAKGLIRSVRKDVKLLGVGELTKKLSITVHGASATAREKVEAAGGTLTLLSEPKVRKAKKRKAGPRLAADRGRGGRRRRRPRLPAAEADRRRAPRRAPRPSRKARSSSCCPGSRTPGASRSFGAGCSSRPRCSPPTGSARGCRLPASTRRRSRTTSAARAAASSAC